MVIEYKTPDEIEEMHYTGKKLHQTLQTLKERTKVGTNLLEIDQWTKELIDQAGGVSSYYDYAPRFSQYHPFAHYICTSVNDAVLHGRPHDYKLKAGDLLSLDLAFAINGWTADAAISFVVGAKPNPIQERLLNAVENAFYQGLKFAQVGNYIGDISHAIGMEAKKYRLPPPNTQYGGHGIGRTMHEEPSVSNDGKRGTGLELNPGLVIAIEPWFMATTNVLKTDKDSWTLKSNDGSLGAHYEHTVAITENGPLVLTDGK